MKIQIIAGVWKVTHAVFILILLLNFSWSVRIEGRLPTIFDRKIKANQLLYLLTSQTPNPCERRAPYLKTCIFLHLNAQLKQLYASDQGFSVKHFSDRKFRPKPNSLPLKYNCSASNFNKNRFLTGRPTRWLKSGLCHLLSHSVLVNFC